MEDPLLSDEELIRLIATERGDEVSQRGEAAIRLLLQRYAPRLTMAMRRRYGSSTSDADIEEVLDDTFTTVWNIADTYRDHGVPASVWIWRIYENRSRDHHRRMRRHQRRREDLSEDVDSRVAPSAIPYDAVELAVDLGFLLNRFRTAYPADGDLIDRRYFKHEEPAEIAKALNVSPSTVRVRLHRALLKLRAMLDLDNSRKEEAPA